MCCLSWHFLNVPSFFLYLDISWARQPLRTIYYILMIHYSDIRLLHFPWFYSYFYLKMKITIFLGVVWIKKNTLITKTKDYILFWGSSKVDALILKGVIPSSRTMYIYKSHATWLVRKQGPREKTKLTQKWKQHEKDFSNKTVSLDCIAKSNLQYNQTSWPSRPCCLMSHW